jgi:hypothetical protein
MPSPTLKAEGIRTVDFALAMQAADVSVAGFDTEELLIEPLLKSSSQGPVTRELPTSPVERKRRLPKFPWSKAPSFYQVTPLLTVALTTTALAMPRPAIANDFQGVAQTPIHHFLWPENTDASYPADDVVSAAQIRALDELLAIPLGPELDIHIDDWA